MPSFSDCSEIIPVPVPWISRLFGDLGVLMPWPPVCSEFFTQRFRGLRAVLRFWRVNAAAFGLFGDFYRIGTVVFATL